MRSFTCDCGRVLKEIVRVHPDFGYFVSAVQLSLIESPRSGRVPSDIRNSPACVRCPECGRIREIPALIA